MLYAHFVSAWRNLLRQPFSSFINISGMAIGITCCIYISLYVWSEINADAFHPKSSQIYRVNELFPESDRAGMSNPYPFGTSLKNEFAAIKDIVRFGQDNVSIRASDDAYYYEDKFFWTDESVFEVFGFDVIQGDRATAMSDPHSLVMTETAARKYFHDNDPIGKTVDLKIYDGDRKFTFTVTAVVADPPRNSTIQFQFLAPMRAAMQVYPRFETIWNLSWVSTYARIEDADAIPAMEEKASSFYEKYAGKDFSRNGLEFQPMDKLHLYSGHVGRNATDGIVNIYVFSVIGGLIFLLACVNFINISTARAESRKKEIGVRKSLGAFRSNLFMQFMTESILTSIIVLIVAFAMTSALQPLAHDYIEDTSILFSAFVLPLAFVTSILLITIFAGLYPAAFLSSFKPLDALKSRAERHSGFSLRQVLVVFQFAISIALIAGTLTINKQVHFLKRANLGMTTEQLITIPVDERELQQKIKAIRDFMGSTVGVTGIAVTGETFPAAMNNTWDIRWQGKTTEQNAGIDVVAIDENYFNLIQAEFSKGRNRSANFATDDSSAFIVNEAAMTMMGLSEEGSEVTIGGRKGRIIGVVKDIHHYSLHQHVRPIAYFPVPAGDRACADNLLLKVSGTNLNETIAALKTKWQTLSDDRPFDYGFVDVAFAEAYAQEEKFLVLFEVFAGLAIVIACLGLLGLSSFVLSKRSKEIGIRKVLGSTATQILVMLTKGFSTPILIAFLIAGPGVYLLMQYWLNKFAYKVSVDIGLIALSGLLAWAIAFIFIGFQSWKAARMNPSVSLKDE